jgi:hypothetical protein
MGLLDGLNDPISMGLLGAGAALLQPRRVGFGDAINAFQGSAVETQNRVALQKRNEQQTQLLMMQLAQMKEAQEMAKRRAEMARGAAGPQGFDAAAYQQRLLGAGDMEGATQASGFIPKAPAPYTLKPGETRFGGNDQPIANVPGEEKLDALIIRGPDGSPMINPLALRAREQLAKAGASQVNVGLQSPYAGVDSQGNPIVVQPANKPGVAPQVLTGPDGKPIRPATDAKPPTEFEAKAGLYFKSMTQASQTLDKLEKAGSAMVGVQEAIVPGDQSPLRNIVRSADRQSYVQAQRQWVDSINRVRSGANLPELEYERAVKTFFPEFGDGQRTIVQKATARKNEEKAMQDAAGRALPKGPATNNSSANDLRKKYGLPPL